MGFDFCTVLIIEEVYSLSLRLIIQYAGSHMGVSENSGHPICGPYNKDPSI